MLACYYQEAPGARGLSELLTVDEAAEVLRLQPATVRDWVLKRRIPYVKVGRLVRLRRSDLDAYLAAAVVPARSEDGV